MTKAIYNRAGRLIPLARRHEYIVQQGDTLADILRISGASVKDVMLHNARLDVFNLQPGQRLRLPHAHSGKFTYRVRRNENVYSLACKFGSSVVALLRVNPHLRPSEIRFGARIALPKE